VKRADAPDRSSFARFVAASGLAAAISVSVVALLGNWVDMSSTGWHVGVVATAYFCAARVNFELQRRWVFRQQATPSGAAAFVSFLVVNGSVSLLVACLSASLMKWSWLLSAAGERAPVYTLLLAAMASAPVSFLLTRRVIAHPLARPGVAPCHT
jgi:putative flippase GtrA